MIPLIERFAAVDKAAVMKFEVAFGHVLPSDYFDFLSHAKGWALTLTGFISVFGANEPISVENFFVITGQWERGLDEDYVEPNLGKQYTASIPKEFLPVASGHEGAFVMDFRPKAHGQIYFVDTHHRFGRLNPEPFLTAEFFESRGYEADYRYSYVKVADNFTEFVNKIELSEWED